MSLKTARRARIRSTENFKTFRHVYKPPNIVIKFISLPVRDLRRGSKLLKFRQIGKNSILQILVMAAQLDISTRLFFLLEVYSGNFFKVIVVTQITKQTNE